VRRQTSWPVAPGTLTTALLGWMEQYVMKNRFAVLAASVLVKI
jgi:hypothetical protein